MSSASFLLTIVAFLLCTCVAFDQYSGDRCRMRRSNVRGFCVLLDNCPYAVTQLHRNIRPTLCGFDGPEPIVCCPRTSQNINNPSVPLSPGGKSKAKCEEYTNSKSAVTDGRPQIVFSVVGGVRASAKEFPHMAVLGFGDENDIQWQCGGTLISDEFVLTAAHCLFSQELGDVKYVRLGDLDLRIITDDAEPQEFGVSGIFRNPNYSPPSQYNDIGLVKLDRPARLTPYVKPACLQTERNFPTDAKLIATGWGRLGFTGETSDQLMKVNLTYFTNEQCREVYDNAPKRRLADGIVDDIQICAGGVNESKDTCQGDSGGPLQMEVSKKPQRFDIVGVTSFGKACGVENIPGVYTRVSSYIPWIEQIVWPD